MLGVDLVGSRRIEPAHVGWTVGLDGSRRIQKDRLDDQADDQGLSDRIGCQGEQLSIEPSQTAVLDRSMSRAGRSSQVPDWRALCRANQLCFPRRSAVCCPATSDRRPPLGRRPGSEPAGRRPPERLGRGQRRRRVRTAMPQLSPEASDFSWLVGNFARRTPGVAPTARSVAWCSTSTQCAWVLLVQLRRLSRSPWNFGGGPMGDQAAASSLVGVTAGDGLRRGRRAGRAGAGGR